MRGDNMTALSPLLSELFCLCLQFFLFFFSLRCSSPSPSNIHHRTRAVGRRSKPPAHTASPPTLATRCWPLTIALLTLMEWRGGSASEYRLKKIAEGRDKQLFIFTNLHCSECYYSVSLAHYVLLNKRLLISQQGHVCMHESWMISFVMFVFYTADTDCFWHCGE